MSLNNFKMASLNDKINEEKEKPFKEEEKKEEVVVSSKSKKLSKKQTYGKSKKNK